MTPERWEQICGVLEKALEVQPQERSCFLDRACASDSALRQEVEILLKSSDDMRSSFLHAPPARVTLPPGTRLGDYEVQNLLGAGGMGEVYRARDPRLGRDVAIKILPALFSRDAERLRRFEQEARAAAALNHPNILAVHQMGSHQGSPYLVSELLEGETLREQLKRGRFTARKAIDYGVQIARGLSAAHEKGIVHRDLKPENIFVTRDGRAKILDFGLAKLTQPQPGSQHSAPTAGEETEPGAVMGTVGYMSPEQVRGQPADHRTDIFSFGVILYEMLAGKRAFQKATPADTQSAILNEDPPSLSQVTTNVPAPLQRVVERCLEKNPEQRFQSASDLAFALEAQSPLSEPVGSTLTLTGTRRPRLRSFGITALALAVVVVSGFVSYKFLGQITAPIDTRKISIHELTDHGQVVDFAAVSGDGKMIAYCRQEGEQYSLRVKQTATASEVIAVPPQSGSFSRGATFSPDGNYLYYLHTDPTNTSSLNLYAVAVFGGTSHQLVSSVGSVPAFSPDGKRMAYLRFPGNGESHLLIANADGTSESEVLHNMKDSGERWHGVISWSGSLNLLAMTASGPQENGTGTILILTPEGKEVRRFSLPLLVYYVAWMPDGSGLFFTGAERANGFRQQIWFQPYPSGEPVKISNDLNTYYSLGIAADGKALVATQRRPQATIYVGDSPAVLNDKIDWKLTPISTEQATGYDLSWTAAGKLLQTDLGKRAYLTEADGSDRTQLLQNDQRLQSAVACGPGNMVVFPMLDENNLQRLWRLNTATGETKRLTSDNLDRVPSCTPDGKWAVYLGWLPNDTLGRIFKISMDGGTPVELARGTVYSPSISPDGASVVYNRIEGHGADMKTKSVIQKLEAGSPLHELNLPSNFIATQLGWTPDGRAITYLRKVLGSTNQLFMQPLDGGLPVRLMQFDSEPSDIVAYAWSRDGKKVAVTRARRNDTDVVMFSGYR